MGLTDEIRHHIQLVLQLKVLVKRSQKRLKDLLAMHQTQDLGLGIASTLLIN